MKYRNNRICALLLIGSIAAGCSIPEKNAQPYQTPREYNDELWQKMDDAYRDNQKNKPPAKDGRKSPRWDRNELITPNQPKK